VPSVNISARIEYACLALLELANHYDEGVPVRVRDIAQKQGIPARFLVQILLQLKGAGLVTSIRGASGGYQLVHDPAAMTLADVLRVMQGGEGEIRRSCSNDTAQCRALLSVWNELAGARQAILEGTTFAELLERSSSSAEHMYYI